MSGPPGQLTHHTNAAEVRVGEVLPELLLHPARVVAEGRGRGPVDLQKRERREVADDVVDLRVQRQPVEEGQVQRESTALAPGAEDLGEGGTEQRRRRETGGAGPRLDSAPDLGLEAMLAADEAGTAHLAGAACERQLGRGRKRPEAGAPVFL
jgi:hypothetical protein